jgi:DNA-binding NarL/FixJ family response regulator
MPSIKVLIVEDDRDWLRGLKAYLSMQADIEVTATASTRNEAFEQLERHEIDVILMDIMLSGDIEGIAITAEVCQTYGTKVIMLTSLEEKEIIFEAFKAGALDYHVKSNFEGIPGAVRSAYKNHAPINAAVADQMRMEFRRLKQLERDFKKQELKRELTSMELQILDCIDRGLTQTEISEHFVISIRTVKIHVGHILKKLNVGSSKEAAELVRSYGLLPL